MAGRGAHLKAVVARVQEVGFMGDAQVLNQRHHTEDVSGHSSRNSREIAQQTPPTCESDRLQT